MSGRERYRFGLHELPVKRTTKGRLPFLSRASAVGSFALRYAQEVPLRIFAPAIHPVIAAHGNRKGGVLLCGFRALGEKQGVRLNVDEATTDFSQRPPR